MDKGRPNGANESTGRVAADEADAEARLNRLLADLELLSRAATELSERETRLLNGCRTAWHCLQRAPELSERGRWARDVLVAAMGGRQPRWSGPESPFEAARAYIGEDYPEAGWPDGQPSGRRP
jgi:hypothetical protein